MENLILDFYEHMQKQNNIKNGLNRYSKKIRIIIIISLIVWVLSLISMFFLMLFFPKQVWFLIALVFCVVAIILLTVFDTLNRKKNIEERVEVLKKKTKLLNDILKDEFLIDTKEKLYELILIYQKHIDETKKADQIKNRIFISLTTSILTFLAALFKNMGNSIIAYDFWLTIGFFLILGICISCAIVYGSIYFNKYYNNTNQKYKSIINDLQYLKLSNY